MILGKAMLYDLPAGHAYLRPAMTVEIVAVRVDQWVAYKNDTDNGCSRYDHFIQNATRHQISRKPAT